MLRGGTRPHLLRSIATLTLVWANSACSTNPMPKTFSSFKLGMKLDDAVAHVADDSRFPEGTFSVGFDTGGINLSISQLPKAKAAAVAAIEKARQQALTSTTEAYKHEKISEGSASLVLKPAQDFTKAVFDFEKGILAKASFDLATSDAAVFDEVVEQAKKRFGEEYKFERSDGKYGCADDRSWTWYQCKDLTWYRVAERKCSDGSAGVTIDVQALDPSGGIYKEECSTKKGPSL